jgi:nuclear pore complex protein Nup133
VEQLPALPEQIRSRATSTVPPPFAKVQNTDEYYLAPYSCTISSEYGYALGLTSSEALIWSYNASSTTPSTKDLFAFKLPFPPSAPTQPLPLGAFTSHSVGSEPGLVVVTPTSGRIVYWETITNASSLLPSQTSNGVQSSVPGMFSGETISDVVSAEPAGFILIFSHGRVAHLTVKDPLGRPAIGVQFLRKSGGANSGGLFGSIRNIIGGDRRKPVAAVRSGNATKGQRDVVVVTEEGQVEHWSIHLNLGDSLSFELDLKQDLLHALKHDLPDDPKGDLLLRILDFVLLESSAKGNELARVNGSSSYPILLLACLTHQGNSTFYIVEVHASAEGSSITVVHPISCYKPSISEFSEWKPRLCVPKHGQIAFVLFETAIVIFSLAKFEESPSSQLLIEGQSLPQPFQDCIKFQDHTIHRVLGYVSEDKGSQDRNAPSILTALQGFGIIRIKSIGCLVSNDEPEEIKITLKSRIEQAIFYGTIRQNPLDLSSTEQQTYSSEEMEQAALNISHEILSSASKYIPKASPSVDHHLKLRAKALDDLALHVQKHYGPLPRILKWKLLWGAEKLAAARAMWKVQEDIIRRKPQDRKETYWEQLLFFMDSRYRTKADKTKGETDWVRLWLIKDVYRIEYLLNWLFEGHKEVKDDDYLSENEMVENIRESSDLWIAGLEATYRFREDNAPLYGLEDEIFDTQHGILKSGYKDLPEIWTLQTKTVRMGECLLELVYNTIREWWEASKTDDPAKPTRKTVIHMAHALPKEVDLYQRTFAERYSWLMEQDHDEFPKYLAQAKKMMEWGHFNRREYFYKIAGLGLVQNAIDLAEHWRDMKGLVELNALAGNQLIRRSECSPSTSATEVKKFEQEMESIQERTERFFEKYGSIWATAYFNKMVMQGELGSLLAEGQTDTMRQSYLTQFLRKTRGYQKISWINDVVCEKDFVHAAETLESLASKKVEDMWTKKTEICLAKLARMAAAETGSKATTTEHRNLINGFDDRLTLLALQSRVHAHILPAIGPVIDATGAQQVALETLGKRVGGEKKYPALRALLNDGLGLLLRRKALSPERLIDILTLMNPVTYSGHEEDDPKILGHEFWLSLNVLRLGEIDVSVTEGLNHIIWRRAMIRDDWVLLNDTTDKNDAEVTAAMTQTSLFRTLVDCYEHIHQHPEDSSTIKLLSPSQILDADIFPKSLQKRFRENEVELVLRDLGQENEILKKYVEKGRIKLHYGGLLKMAQATVRAEADRAGDESAGDIGKA